MTKFRTASAVPAQLQTRADETALTISGYFAVFHSAYEIAPGVREFVDPHAFDDTLSDDIRALMNHDTRLVLGRTAANTLRLRIDPHGLAGDITINPDDLDAMNLYARVKRGDVSQCSFGFEILDESANYRDDGSVDFTILRVKLYEVSVVTFPAYAETSAQARSALDARREQIQAFRNARLQARKNALAQLLNQK